MGLDFTNLNINTIKGDLTQNTQPQYGSAITITAGNTIKNGDIVVFDFSSGSVNGIKPLTLPAQNTIAGVAIEDITSGAQGKVLIYGLATVNYRHFIPSSSITILLDSANNGNTTVLQPGSIVSFKDSGSSGSYSSNQTYTYIFDSGQKGEKVQLKINQFEFEGSGTTSYDRLGFQESDDDITYINCAFGPPGLVSGEPSTGSTNQGWRQMINTNSWQTGIQPVLPGLYSDGYVLPALDGGNSTTGGRAILKGLGPKGLWTSTKRYLKAFFYSDGSVVRDGWDIDVNTTAAVNQGFTGLGTYVYLDNQQVARATNETGTGRLIGISTGGSYTNSLPSSTVIFVEPPRVT